MRQLTFAGCIAALLGIFLSIAPAHAQATRTWVSGVGDDVNPCSRTAPCKTFAGTISKTAAGGEINCLDPGGFGAITITKAITLNCIATLGSILGEGTFAVTVNAGANDRVTLRGLQIQGINQAPSPNVPGTIGVRILNGKAVSIEDCAITGFGQQGVIDTRSAGQTRLYIKDSVITNNIGAGIVAAATATNIVVLDNVRSQNNLYGLATGNMNNVIVNRSVFSGNSAAGVEVDGGGQLNVMSSVMSHNGTGVQNGGTAWVSDSTIAFNNAAISGVVTTFGNSRLVGNVVIGGTLSPAGGATTDFGQQ